MTKTLAHAIQAAVNHGHASSKLDRAIDERAELTPLDVVLVLLDFEEVERLHVPLEEFATVRTVGDLLRALSDERGRSRGLRR